MAKTGGNSPSARELKAEAKKLRKRPKISRPRRCCIDTYWAVVDTDGTLIRGRNVKRVGFNPEGVGTYEVIFAGKVDNGVYQATIGRFGIGTEEPGGEIGVALRCCLPPSEAGRGVWVDTHNSNGTRANKAFHLVVHTD